ncbi:MAG: Rab family GTPase [Candidatus Hodarchaeota archaeon]
MASKGSFLVKIVLAGDGAVGKTTLRRRYLGEGFQASYLMTIGADFAVKTVEVSERTIKFQLWDLAGQPRFQVVREMYYRGALGGLLVFDVTRWDSFKNLPHWLEELWRSNGRGAVPVVLVGNKTDLRMDGPDFISKEYGEKYSQDVSTVTQQYGFTVPYIETSAKTGELVDEAFRILGSNIISYLNASGQNG